MRATSIVDVVLGEAKAGDFSDMKAIASVIRNRAEELGVTPEDVVSAPGEFSAYGRKLPGGVSKFRALAERALAEVKATGPTTTATFYATPTAARNLPAGLKQVGSTKGHHYFTDPKNRAIQTAVGYAKPQKSNLPATAPRPETAPRGQGLFAQAMGGLGANLAQAGNSFANRPKGLGGSYPGSNVAPDFSPGFAALSAPSSPASGMAMNEPDPARFAPELSAPSQPAGLGASMYGDPNAYGGPANRPMPGGMPMGLGAATASVGQGANTAGLFSPNQIGQDQIDAAMATRAWGPNPAQTQASIAAYRDPMNVQARQEAARLSAARQANAGLSAYTSPTADQQPGAFDAMLAGMDKPQTAPTVAPVQAQPTAPPDLSGISQAVASVNKVSSWPGQPPSSPNGLMADLAGWSQKPPEAEPAPINPPDQTTATPDDSNTFPDAPATPEPSRWDRVKAAMKPAMRNAMIGGLLGGPTGAAIGLGLGLMPDASSLGLGGDPFSQPGLSPHTIGSGMVAMQAAMGGERGARAQSRSNPSMSYTSLGPRQGGLRRSDRFGWTEVVGPDGETRGIHYDNGGGLLGGLFGGLGGLFGGGSGGGFSKAERDSYSGRAGLY